MHLLICTKLRLITKDVIWHANGFLWTRINGFIVSSVSWHFSLLPCLLSPAEAQKRKSKWDSAIPVTLAQPTIITTSATLPSVVSVTTTASGTKTTVISAVGTIQKKAKQWHQTGPESRLVSLKLEDPCRPVPLINVKKKKSKRYREGTNELMDVFPSNTQMPFSPYPLELLSKASPPSFSGIVSALACR